MDLILWRHAEAQDDVPRGGDLARALTPRGQKQAARMAEWLLRHLPKDARILCSPAVRCEQTVRALGRRYEVAAALAPGADAAQVLEAVQWPGGDETVLVVGHQPTLGEVVAHLLALQDADCTVRKGAAWWLRSRAGAHRPAVVQAVQSPDTL
jgi:phosphohistidine phosphatase